MTKEQQQVKDILLMPIENISLIPVECSIKEPIKICRYDNKIYSSKQYYKYNAFDPDMSDFAVEFYKIIYKEKLKEQEYEILKGNVLKNKDFCGDTMNSYKTIAKKIKDPKKKEQWEKRYHCLANFWLLPMHVGHSSRWTNKFGLYEYSKSQLGSLDDYMDKFLQYYLKKHEQYLTRYPDYARKFTPDSYGVDHFIEGIYVKNNEVIRFSDKKPDDVVTEMWNKIEKRADCIARKKGAELYESFSKRRITYTQANSN